MKRKFFFILVIAVVHQGVSQKASSTPADTAFGNVDYITRHQLHDYLSFIASDSLQGRDTPSDGQNIAAKFLASHLSQWGFKDVSRTGAYFQNIALLRSKINPGKTTITINGRQFSFGTDFISTPVAASITAPLVYVQNGFMIKARTINPYKGIDVRGKIMVVLGGFPRGTSLNDLAGRKGIDYDTPLNYAKNNGAVAVIAISSSKAMANWENGERNSVEQGEVSVLKFRGIDTQPVAAITASEHFIDALFEKEKIGVRSMWHRPYTDTVQPFVFSSATKVTLNISTFDDTVNTQNVVAVLEGSDSTLKNEYVAFGAHYDHIGISAPVEGDSINNGADDDGSGTVSLLACAEAFAKGPRPKRSLLFVWHVAEEKGLLGSKYFVRYPPIPLNAIITQLNVDMIGRSKPDTGVGSNNDELSSKGEIFVIGSKMMSTELGRMNEEVNRSFLNLQFNYKFDDPRDPLKLFYRSDHYNYAKNNIPIIFYFDGIHEDYHQVSDEVEKIDFEKLMNVTKTVFVIGWKIANLPKRPTVDKEFPKDVFE